jgi:phosphoribosylformimino-5-aminoimidazole carboxamide ribotide isomerase
MRVIGVIDLAGGMAVHARRGIRARYAPVEVAAGRPIGGDPITLARTYLNHLGLTELYAADLDAITSGAGRSATGGDRGEHQAIVRELSAMAPLWLDAATSSPDDARLALDLGAWRVIVGLETLGSFDALRAICAAVGRERVAFGLDLRGGVPIAPRLDVSPGEPEYLAARAAEIGVGTVIVLDLARVGEAAGPDLQLIARVRAAAPGTPLIVGGGMRGLEDLERLAEAGCDGALVATALHDSRLNAGDVRGLLHASGSR